MLKCTFDQNSGRDPDKPAVSDQEKHTVSQSVSDPPCDVLLFLCASRSESRLVFVSSAP